MVKQIWIAILMLIFNTPMVCLAVDSPTKDPKAFLPESVYEFAPVVEGTKVEHDFTIQNQGDEPLVIYDLKSG